MTGPRKTFVVSLREEEGSAMVHDVDTGRKARLQLRDLPGQIERWLKEAKPSRSDVN